ncbi:mitochondrial nicotinamide adenine dinucleotide transporter SLC25A52-like [Clytia hemisphaerica]|uniref:Solute carrier family 25 member 51 n=1 Tax=Clytia hemisphaerica TaxID=252671 RepID=A0A7M5X5A1_9CNID|eukprot:TCONS_00013713-protein
MLENKEKGESKNTLQTNTTIKHDTKGWHEFAAGGCAAVVNIMVTFPVYKTMLRQQIDGITMLKAVTQIKHEGLFKLYRGVGPPLMQKGISCSIMFGSYHSIQKKLVETYPRTNETFLKIVAAMTAGSFESLMTPFERVQTLLAISEHKDYVKVHNTVHAFLKIKKHHNFKEYYRGFTAILLRNGPSTALFFLLREPIKDLLPTAESGLTNVAEDFVSGAVLGASISTLAYPLNVVKSNMQKRLGEEYRGIMYTFREVYNQRERSIRRIYFGVSLNFSRALISWGIINATYEIFIKFLNEVDP